MEVASKSELTSRLELADAFAIFGEIYAICNGGSTAKHIFDTKIAETM